MPDRVHSTRRQGRPVRERAAAGRGVARTRTEAVSDADHRHACLEVEGVTDVITVNGFSLLWRCGVECGTDDPDSGDHVGCERTDARACRWFRDSARHQPFSLAAVDRKREAFAFPPATHHRASVPPVRIEAQLQDLCRASSPQQLGFCGAQSRLQRRIRIPHPVPGCSARTRRTCRSCSWTWIATRRTVARNLSVSDHLLHAAGQSGLVATSTTSICSGRSIGFIIQAEAEDRDAIDDVGQHTRAQRRTATWCRCERWSTSTRCSGRSAITRYNQVQLGLGDRLERSEGASTGDAIAGARRGLRRRRCRTAYGIEWTGTTATGARSRWPRSADLRSRWLLVFAYLVPGRAVRELEHADLGDPFGCHCHLRRAAAAMALLPFAGATTCTRRSVSSC